MSAPRPIAAFIVLAVFLTFFLFAGVDNNAKSLMGGLLDSKNAPDFSKYVRLRTLSSEDFPIDEHNKRVMVIGDVHGDIIAKGSLEGSLAVLSYMTNNNITGVRGNHDQKVIEWRAWLDWITSLPGGKTWLQEVNEGPELDIDEEVKGPNRHWWKKIPKEWEMYSDHYKIAHSMSRAQYEYLLSRPLKLHVPSTHTFLVHAGLLASDPRYKSTHPRQPLSRVPNLPFALSQYYDGDDEKKEILRTLQEEAILEDIYPNTDPFNNLNMRSVLSGGEVTRKKKGTPWSELWNEDMSRCDGFDVETKKHKKSLPCYPATVIYGHAASRGLDIKRWSFGMDSGCVYSNQLTALVLGEDSRHHLDDMEESSKAGSKIPFGDDHHGRIVNVDCY